MEDLKYQYFAIYAEAQGYERPLVVLNLSFAKLLDDIVVPYQSNEPFFVDGAPITRDKIRRLKILKVDVHFESALKTFHTKMSRNDTARQKLYGEQYHIRVEAMLREHGEDVTAQVIKAFDSTIKPTIKDYLPKRQELIQAASKVFIEGMKFLGNT